MLCTRPLAVFFLLLFSTPVLASGPHPPQLSVSFLAPPAPIVQDGSTRLVYEMVVSNFSKSRYVLDTIEARAGQTHSSFSGASVHHRAVRVEWKARDRCRGTIEGANVAVIFLMLDLGKSQAPGAIEHSLHVLNLRTW